MVNPYKRPAFGINELITSLQQYAFTRRIKVQDLFKDFDKLRCYSISKSEFERGIYKIGYHFTQDEVNLICSHYQNTSIPNMCLWKEFCKDIEKSSFVSNIVFGEPNLESRPSYIHEKAPEISPFASTGLPLTAKEEAILQKTMEKIKDHLKFRKPSVKLFFRDCDRINSAYGHVTKSQLRQCLLFMECDVNDEEFAVICKKWAKITPDLVKQKDFNYINDRGTSVCYIHFLQEIEDAIAENAPTFKPLLKKKVSPPEEQPEVNHHSEFEKLMMKIKIKAKTERIRVIDSMADFDHLRHGRISKFEFCRAVKVLFSDLCEVMVVINYKKDLEILSSNYAVEGGNVDYVKFSDEVESVFTKKGLVNTPTDNPDVFDVYSNG
jgi:hypothetical protein